jgi:hypothetical protein
VVSAPNNLASLEKHVKGGSMFLADYAAVGASDLVHHGQARARLRTARSLDPFEIFSGMFVSLNPAGRELFWFAHER